MASKRVIASLVLLIAVLVSIGVFYYYTVTAGGKGSGEEGGGDHGYTRLVPGDPVIDDIEEKLRRSHGAVIEERFQSTYNGAVETYGRDNRWVQGSSRIYEWYKERERYSSLGRIMLYRYMVMESTVLGFLLSSDKSSYVEGVAENLSRAAGYLDAIRGDLNYTYENIGVFHANYKLSLVVILENIYKSALYAARMNRNLVGLYKSYVNSSQPRYAEDRLMTALWLSGNSIYDVLMLYPLIHEAIHDESLIDFSLRTNMTIEYMENKTIKLWAEAAEKYNESYILLDNLSRRHGLVDVFILLLKSRLNTLRNRTVAATSLDKYRVVGEYVAALAGYARAHATYMALRDLAGIAERGADIDNETLEELKRLVNETRRNASRSYWREPAIAYVLYGPGSPATWLLSSLERVEDSVRRESGTAWLNRYYYTGYRAAYHYYKALPGLVEKYLEPRIGG